MPEVMTARLSLTTYFMPDQNRLCVSLTVFCITTRSLTIDMLKANMRTIGRSPLIFL